MRRVYRLTDDEAQTIIDALLDAENAARSEARIASTYDVMPSVGVLLDDLYDQAEACADVRRRIARTGETKR